MDDITPRPDPTVLTTAQLFREIEHVNALFGVRLDSNLSVFEEHERLLISRLDELERRLVDVNEIANSYTRAQESYMLKETWNSWQAIYQTRHEEIRQMGLKNAADIATLRLVTMFATSIALIAIVLIGIALATNKL